MYNVDSSQSALTSPFKLNNPFWYCKDNKPSIDLMYNGYDATDIVEHNDSTQFKNHIMHHPQPPKKQQKLQFTVK